MLCVGGPCHGEHTEQRGATFHTYDPERCCMVVYRRKEDTYVIDGLTPSQLAEYRADLGLPQ